MTESDRPSQGEIIAVRGSPGPASGIRIDVAVTSSTGDFVYRDVYPIGMPSEYDINIEASWGCAITYRGDGEARFWCIFHPVLSSCPGGAP